MPGHLSSGTFAKGKNMKLIQSFIFETAHRYAVKVRTMNASRVELTLGRIIRNQSLSTERTLPSNIAMPKSEGCIHVFFGDCRWSPIEQSVARSLITALVCWLRQCEIFQIG